jgi:hypothetical protein
VGSADGPEGIGFVIFLVVLDLARGLEALEKRDEPLALGRMRCVLGAGCCGGGDILAGVNGEASKVGQVDGVVDGCAALGQSSDLGYGKGLDVGQGADAAAGVKPTSSCGEEGKEEREIVRDRQTSNFSSRCTGLMVELPPTLNSNQTVRTAVPLTLVGD